MSTGGVDGKEPKRRTKQQHSERGGGTTLHRYFIVERPAPRKRLMPPRRSLKGYPHAHAEIGQSLIVPRQIGIGDVIEKYR